MRTIRNICLLAALLMSYTAISPIATAGYSVAVLIPTVTGTAVKNVTIRGSKALIKVSKDGSVRVMDDVSDDVMKAFLRDSEAAFTKETYDALQTKTGRELKEGIEAALKGVAATDLATIKNLLRRRLDTDTYTKLIADFGEESPDLIRFIDNGTVNDELINSWKTLKDAGRTMLCKDINAIEALNKVGKNPNLINHGITEEMLVKIDGFGPPPVGYVEILEDLNKALDILPGNKTQNFVDVISHGNRGLVNNSSVGAYDRRHSWYMLKKIQDNESFIKNADEITFEIELEVIEGIQQAIPDIYIKIGDNKYIGEVFAGQTGVKTNLASQIIRYCQEITDLNQLRFFSHRVQNKEAVIKAWKDGGVLNNDKIFNLFQKYDSEKFRAIETVVDFETYLRNNDGWFELIFKANFK